MFCVSFIGIQAHVTYSLMKKTPAEKKALANGGSKDGLLFSGGRTIRWPRPRPPIIKSAEFRNKTFKDAVSAVSQTPKKRTGAPRISRTNPSLKIMKSFQNFIFVLTITYLASDYSIASPVQEPKGNI